MPVKQVGTSTTSVSGTVGIDPSQNTVNLDSTGNTVNLDSTDSGHLASIESDLGNLKFDGSGNLETTAQTTSPGAVSDVCLPDNSDVGGWAVKNDDMLHTICSEDAFVTGITATGMDDDLGVRFMYKGNIVLILWGSSQDGQASYQMDLTHPIYIDEIQAFCNNASTNCDFNMAVLGNSTGN